jgi:sugar O-acyltransferase (sialic acid O-acetyltransferase NeuD family)
LTFVVGTRSFAAEVLGYAREAGIEVSGLLEHDEQSRAGTVIHGLDVRLLEDCPPGTRVLIGTGDRDRRKVVERLLAAGLEPQTLVHPAAHVPDSCEVGGGTILAPGVVLGSHSAVGAHAVIGRGSLVGHHTTIGEFATVGPGSNIAGNTAIGAAAFLGMSAVVRDHLTVGAEAEIGMGSLVLEDVARGARVRGAPARTVD